MCLQTITTVSNFLGDVFEFFDPDIFFSWLDVLKLKETSPVLFEENISNFKLIESLGEIKEGLFFKLEITNPSKDIYLIKGRIVSVLKSQCQSCLLDTDIIINIDSITTIKDSELQLDNDKNHCLYLL